MSSDEDYKNELLDHLGNAVKQVQLEIMSRDDLGVLRQVGPCITNDSPSGRILFSCLEMVFHHGLKSKQHGIWEVVQYFCRSDIIHKIQSLKHVFTNIGKGRAWIYLALNEKELESYLQSFQMDLSHMYKYYHRRAMVCSSQAPILQTLISGLDFVNFQLNLDSNYLDFSIKWSKDRSISVSSTQKVPRRPVERGSAVHIDTQSLARTGQKAVGFVKEMLSHETKPPEKSMDNINTIALVAVNANQAPLKKYCQDCNSFYDLLCFCVKPSQEVNNVSVPSTNAKILEDALGRKEVNFEDNRPSSVSSDAASSVAVPYRQQRFNPFNKSCENESDTGPVLRRFDQEYPTFDAPVEVRHRKIRRKKKFSETSSDISTRSDGVIQTWKNVGVNGMESNIKRLGSFSDMCLSDPLIDFDPDRNTVTDKPSSRFDTLTVDVANDPQLFTHDAKGVTDAFDRVTADGVNEKCNKQLTQTNETDSVVVSSQDSVITGSLVVEFSSGDTGSLPLTDDRRDYCTKMESPNVVEDPLDTRLDGNENNLKGKQVSVDLVVQFSSGDTMSHPLTDDQRDDCAKMDAPKLVEAASDTTADSNKTSSETVQDTHSCNKAVKTKVEGDPLHPEGREEISVGCQRNLHPEDDHDLMPGNAVAANFADEEYPSEEEFASGSSFPDLSKEISPGGSGSGSQNSASFSCSMSKRTDSEMLSKSDTQWPNELSLKEKQNIRKSKGMRRYRSESEQLLNALTQKEVERLRAEIQMKLKPSRDRLEKVRKSIEEKKQCPERFGSLPRDSFMFDKTQDSETTSSSSCRQLDDASDDGTEPDSVSSIGHDTDSELVPRHSGSHSISSLSSSPLSAKLLGSRISHPLNTDPPENHKSVADIDNNLRLYLVLEILIDENEEILKLFHVSTGHSEGNCLALYLLFSDSFIYFLRSGDGSCPYRTEHTVSYEDLDYTSVGYNNQTIEFAFYSFKAKTTPKLSRAARGRIRTKIVIDTGEKHLTDLIIAILTKAIQVFMGRQTVLIKVCPPVFHDAREHQISLIKYLRQEGMTGDIQLYQLVHWEDPDFISGAKLAKVSLEGTLKYKTQSFWGSSWKSAYFVLTGGILYQYTNKERAKPDTSYELTGNNCVGCKRFRSSSSLSPSLEFEVNFKDESKLELCGYSEVEVTDWLQCLCMIVSLDQSSTIDGGAATDEMVANMLNHDALVPCGLIVADETLFLCHEDQHTGFCRTLAKAQRQDIIAINVEREKSFVCEIIVEASSRNCISTKWGIFFPNKNPLELFLGVINSFSKPPTLCYKGDDSSLAHYMEARTLLDNRWTRTDNLLKGRGGSAENYTFI